MILPPLRQHPRAVDPGQEWTDTLLAPLRRRAAEVDVSAAVMRRIAAALPAPAPAPLPARWARLSWAASLILGVAALGLLLVTGGVMAFGSDQSAGALWTLAATAGRLIVHGYGHVGSLAAGLWQAARALLLVGWRLSETAAPVARGAGFLAALAGALSIGVSILIVSRAWRTAPAAGPPARSRVNGGPS